MQDWLAHRARATPSREALINAGSGNAWSYATLDETVEEMAGRLHALGVEQDDHVAAVLGTSVEAVCLVHAAMRLGTTLVPLSPEFTPPELRERLERADADAVVCDAESEETVREAAEAVDQWLSVFTIDDADWSDATPLAEAEPATFTPAEWEREDVQLLLFTSGTTGQPKAVQLTMGNLLASATASAFRLGIDPTDRWLVPLSLHHMGGIAPVLRSTLYGTTVIIRSSFDPGGTVDDLRSYDATCVSLVPTMLRRMLSARGTLPDSLRFVLVGGAPCPEELVDRCRDFSVPICPTYGMTETASQVATAHHREAYEHPSTVGRPLIWTGVTVVDETGTPVPEGESGELVVNGPTVSPGYYDDHASTGEAMGPYGLHTGDVGRLDEAGRLYVLNRLDDRILTGGENVDPGEVIDAVQAHDAVAEAAVVGLPDEEWGERVAALVVPEEEPPELSELESFLRERLAGFKLPRTIGFTDELPRTVSGTIERDAVKEQLLDGETDGIERPVASGRAASSGRADNSEMSEKGAETADADAEREEKADGEVNAEQEKEATVDGETEPEADEREATENEDVADDESAVPGTEPAAAGERAETEADSARSILDDGSDDDRPGSEEAESIDEIERQVEADSAPERGEEHAESGASAASDAEGGENTQSGSVDGSPRRGGAALSGDESGSQVVDAGAGAALGTERETEAHDENESEETEIGEDEENSEADDGGEDSVQADKRSTGRDEEPTAGDESETEGTEEADEDPESGDER